MDPATRPAPAEAAPFYHRYLEQVPDGDIVVRLERQIEDTARLVEGADASYRYAPGKWSIAETLLHMIDTERIFQSRALRFARGDETPLPGFDQDAFAVHYPDQDRSLDSLVGEFRAVRASTLALVRGLDGEAWDRMGVASGHPMSTRGAVWVIAGHEHHHATILRERYLGA